MQTDFDTDQARRIASDPPGREDTWMVLLYDARKDVIATAWRGLTKQEALQRWELWRELDTDSILIPWPEQMRESLEKLMLNRRCTIAEKVATVSCEAD